MNAPTNIYAKVVGIVMLALGVLGMLATTSQGDVAQVLGTFDVNLGHNIIHLAVGLAGVLAGFMAIMSTRTYALVIGAVFALLGAAGIASGAGFDVAGIFGSINIAGSVLNLIVGGAGVTAWYLERGAVSERA